jgi:hypothetical protein
MTKPFSSSRAARKTWRLLADVAFRFCLAGHREEIAQSGKIERSHSRRKSGLRHYASFAGGAMNHHFDSIIDFLSTQTREAAG